MNGLSQYLALLNLVVLPLIAWAIRIERRLVRIETLLEAHQIGKAKTREGDG